MSTKGGKMSPKPSQTAMSAVQTADGAGRVSLGPRFAGRLVIVREIDGTEVVVTAARAVPERDARAGAPGPTRPGRAAGDTRPTRGLADAVADALADAGRPMGWTELAKAVIAAGWPGDRHQHLARAIARVALRDGRLRAEGRTCALSGRGGRGRSGRPGWGPLGDAVAAVLGAAGRPMGVAEITRAALAGGLCADEGDGGSKLMKAIWHTVARELRFGGRIRRAAPGKCELVRAAGGTP